MGENIIHHNMCQKNAFFKDRGKGHTVGNISWLVGGLNKQMIITPIRPLCLKPAESICF